MLFLYYTALAHRAHIEKLKKERDAAAATGGMGTAGAMGTSAATARLPSQAAGQMKIGRPAYQVFKSRDPETNQRCLSFELLYPEIADEVQPRHRFMSAFEQRVETPPDRRYQYVSDLLLSVVCCLHDVPCRSFLVLGTSIVTRTKKLTLIICILFVFVVGPFEQLTKKCAVAVCGTTLRNGRVQNPERTDRQVGKQIRIELGLG